MSRVRTSHVFATIALAAFAAGTSNTRISAHRNTVREMPDRTVKVTGSGFDHLKDALVHATQTTPTGIVQQSTEIVDLRGDLNGQVLYHVTSVFDFVNGTLVNTGDQVFSGTVAASAPVLIHDDQFRFDVNLVSGAESGKVYLLDHIAGPKVRCTLDVVGTGLNADGNPTFDYSGDCTFRGE